MKPITLSFDINMKISTMYYLALISLLIRILINEKDEIRSPKRALSDKNPEDQFLIFFFFFFFEGLYF